MLESFNREFEYQKLSPEEQQQRGILGRLVGPISDSVNPTRNERLYNDECWDTAINDDIFQEKLETRTLYGELNHPSDRTETDLEKVAICLAEQPKKGKDGKLYGVFDILNTPNGNILKVLLDYGSRIGLSSRATGDTYTDANGNEAVEPSSFQLEGWDIVQLPAMKEARPNYVHESFKNNGMKRALTESYKKATVTDKKIMKETLDDLGIDLDEKADTMTVGNIIDDFKSLGNEETVVEFAPLEIDGVKYETTIELGEEKDGKVVLNTIATPIEDGSDTQKSDNIKAKEVSDKEGNEKELADDDGNLEVVENLKEALLGKSKAEAQVFALQQQLAVSDVKVKKLEEELGKAKNVKPDTNVKVVSEDFNKVAELEKEVARKQKTIELQKRRIEGLLVNNQSSKSNLNESLSAKNSEIKTLNESVSQLNETIEKQKNEYEKKIRTMQENFKSFKETAIGQTNELKESVEKSNKLVESWKQLATQTINGYIKNKAVMYGVTPNEIKNRLPETYTIKDVDEVCESLQTMQVNLNKLPFDTNGVTLRAGRLNESHRQQEQVSVDDEFEGIDDQLLNMAHISRKR